VSQLDAGSGTLAVQEIDNAGEWRDVVVLPQAEVGVANATFGGHGGCLEDDQTEAAKRKSAQMHQVPIVGEAILGGILAHGRDNGTIAQGEATERGGRKQLGHEKLSVGLPDNGAYMHPSWTIGKCR
jgi:hypothetical protein